MVRGWSTVSMAFSYLYLKEMSLKSTKLGYGCYFVFTRFLENHK